jgi:hypothetical protein
MRYLGIDLARSVAIIFVILGHALTASNMGDAGVAVQALRFFLGLSPPVFFCLFGCMLQLVYARKYAAGRTTEIVQRLLTRALQCWMLYVLSCAAYCLAAGLPFTYFVRCAMLLGDTPFTDILKFYAMLLLISPMLVHVSVKRGLWPLVAVVAVVQLSYPWISQVPPMQGFPGAGTLSAFLYGGKFIGHTGPSVIHGLGFVVFGMLMGRIWQSRPGREFLLSGPGYKVRAAVCILLATTLAWIWLSDVNLTVPAERIHLRNTNHPLYLLFGCSAAIIFVEVFTVLRRLTGLGNTSTWLVFGRTSLFTFCFGNIILYFAHLWNPEAAPDPVRFVLAASAALALSIAYGKFRDWKGLKSSHPLARAYRWTATDAAESIVRALTSPFLRPARIKRAPHIERVVR